MVEWDGLENRCAGNCTVSSNLTLSAKSAKSSSVMFNVLARGWHCEMESCSFPDCAGKAYRSTIFFNNAFTLMASGVVWVDGSTASPI